VGSNPIDGTRSTQTLVGDHLEQASIAAGGSWLVGMAAPAPSRSQKVSLQEARSSICLLITTVVLSKMKNIACCFPTIRTVGFT
jgi:hypothetical protein